LHTTIARETIKDSTTNACSDRHLPSVRTPTFGGVRVSADFSGSTIERPHEWSTNQSHPYAIAAHESPRTTKLYDHTGDEITLG
jgi:hypothetical protein